MNVNPAYVEWVWMVKGSEEKLVHPGNVENHEHAGWTLKNHPAPAAVEAVEPSAPVETVVPSVAVETPAEPPAPVEDPKVAEKKAKAEAKAAEKKAKAEAKAAEKKAKAEAKAADPE